MRVAINVLYGVVNHLMLKFAQAFVRFQRISEQCGTRFDMLAYFRLKRGLLTVGHDAGTDLTTTFQDPHHGGFVFAASAGDLTGSHVTVHIPRLTADETLI